MPGAIIAFDQARPGGPSFGSPGVARNDGWLNRQVTCRSTQSGNTSYLWEFLENGLPPGSGAVLAGAATANATFTPDVVGTYRVQLTTNGGGSGNVQVLTFAVRYDNSGSLTQRGWRLPAVGETGTENNYSGQARGWAEAFEFIFADLLNLAGQIGGGSASNTGDLINRAGGAQMLTHGASVPAGYVLQSAPQHSNIFSLAYDPTTIGATGQGPFIWYVRGGALDICRLDLAHPTSADVVPLFTTDLKPTLGHAVAGGGFIWVPGHGTTSQLAKVNPADKSVAYFTVANIGGYLAYDGGNTRLLAPAVSGNTLLTIDTGTGVPTSHGVTSADSNLGAVLVAGGSIWLATDGQKVLRLDPTTFATLTTLTPTTATNGVISNFVYVSTGSKVFFANSRTGKLHRIDVAGATIDSTLNLGANTQPNAVTYDGTNIWVAYTAADGTARVRQVTTPGGTPALGLDVALTQPAGFTDPMVPSDVLYSTFDGKLYVADAKDDFIAQVDLTGAPINLFSGGGVATWGPPPLSGGVGAGVANYAALRAVVSSDRADKQGRLVETGQYSTPELFLFNSGVGATFDDDTAGFLKPTDVNVNANGRWELVSSLPTFASLAQMRLAGSGAYKRVWLLGISSPLDGLGGSFQWDGTSVAADDAFDTVQPTGITTGRFVRETISQPTFNARQDGLAASALTAAPGIHLQNTKAATAGVQVQATPLLQFTGTAWASGAAASRSVVGALAMVPIAGTTVSGQLQLRWNIAGAGFGSPGFTWVNDGSWSSSKPDGTTGLSFTAATGVMSWAASYTGLQLTQSQATVNGKGQPFTVASQAAKAGSGSDGGDLVLQTGVGDGAGIPGDFFLSLGPLDLVSATNLAMQVTLNASQPGIYTLLPVIASYGNLPTAKSYFLSDSSGTSNISGLVLQKASDVGRNWLEFHQSTSRWRQGFGATPYTLSWYYSTAALNEGNDLKMSLTTSGDLFIKGKFTVGVPTISEGTVVPASAEPEGSLYLRTGGSNGSGFLRVAGNWVQLNAGPVNLAGGSSSVTGILPAANLPQSASQFQTVQAYTDVEALDTSVLPDVCWCMLRDTKTVYELDKTSTATVDHTFYDVLNTLSGTGRWLRKTEL